jgi:probable aminopeptidase NPEPL1
MSIRYYALDSPGLKAMEPNGHLLLLGTKEALQFCGPNVPFYVNCAVKVSSLEHTGLDPPAPLLRAVTSKLSPTFDTHSCLETWVEVDGTMVRVTLGCLPSGPASRHNSPSKPHAATDIVKSVASGEGTLRVLITLACADHAVALGTAVARAFPLYSHKSSNSKPLRKIEVVFNMTSAALATCTLLNGGASINLSFQGDAKMNGKQQQQQPQQQVFDPSLSILHKCQALADGIQLCARLVDAPPNEMHTDAMVEEAGQVLHRLQKLKTQDNVTVTVVRGEELREKGFGGLYGVGKAAEHPPALVVLTLLPKVMGVGRASSISSSSSSKKDNSVGSSVVWVGKGIVYDTGGLSIKTKTGMPGMKRDMGGAAAILAAFEAAVRIGYHKGPLHAVLCLAENSVAANATRPDDIHEMFSGKTVEINNTDAEGRLVLGDGVAYAVKHLNPSVILDMATLTGAQGVATGKRHAALYCNNEALEEAVVAVGKATGDLAHALPYAPEFFQSEFRSAVADMKNSVASRENAQCSCAGQFVGAQIKEWVEGEGHGWVHVDMAYPVHNGERATGYGVNLLVGLLERL